MSQFKEMWKRRNIGVAFYKTIEGNEYIGIAGRKTGKQYIADCNPTALLVLDIDSDDPLLEEIDCSMLVFSGHGYHCYFELDRLLSREEYRRLYKLLAKRYGGDPKCCDISRLIRIPGTYNDGILCRILRATGKVFNVDDLIEECISEIGEETIVTNSPELIKFDLNVVSAVYGLSPFAAQLLPWIQKYKNSSGILSSLDFPILTRGNNPVRVNRILEGIRVLEDNGLIFQCRRGWIVPSWKRWIKMLGCRTRIVKAATSYFSVMSEFKKCIMGLFGVQKIPCSNQTIAKKLHISKRTVIRNRKSLVKKQILIGARKATSKVLSLVSKFCRTETERIKGELSVVTSQLRGNYFWGNSAESVTFIEGNISNISTLGVCYG